MPEDYTTVRTHRERAKRLKQLRDARGYDTLDETIAALLDAESRVEPAPEADA